MSMKFKKSALLSATALLGFAGTLIAPMSVFADSASGPAGSDANGAGTSPATNPKINWVGGGSAGSVTTISPTGGVNTDATSLAGISWHTDPDRAILSLLAVPNFDFGAWKYTAGTTGTGSSNTNWYPADAGNTITAAYSSAGVTGTANFAPLQADATSMAFDPTTRRTAVDIDGSVAGESARASAAGLGLNASQIANAKNSAAASTAAEAVKNHRVLAVKDGRAGTNGWKVQLSVGSFDRDGSGDGTVTGASPVGSNKQLKGAAIYINVPTTAIGKTADNFNTAASIPTATPVIAYSADVRGTSSSYNYGAAVTVFSADQSSNAGVGAGGWIMDFADKKTASFTSPTEGLGTYTASLKWTLTSGPS